MSNSSYIIINTNTELITITYIIVIIIVVRKNEIVLKRLGYCICSMKYLRKTTLQPHKRI